MILVTILNCNSASRELSHEYPIYDHWKRQSDPIRGHGPQVENPALEVLGIAIYLGFLHRNAK